MSTFEIIRGVEGDSLALDNTRICGPKPWGGGYVIKTFHTDGIYEVIGKNEYRKLIAENAELREQGARLFDKTLELGTENAKLQDENARLCSCLSDDAENARMIMGESAKLRELVRVMAYCMQHSRDCDGCRINGADGIITAPAGCDGLLDRMARAVREGRG